MLSILKVLQTDWFIAGQTISYPSVFIANPDVKYLLSIPIILQTDGVFFKQSNICLKLSQKPSAINTSKTDLQLLLHLQKKKKKTYDK